ncbi:hypothetical protein F2Q70_00024415 [Brassica cretica]|uniref:Uncharacterized protein n=1 Tax=Brassica cretica TaxID=69181 RepID=A0A8S9LCV6_BRACR|nr:hypothetical protein F2Q70_00024415 [Brassica cretica]KAF3580722.1 hypothetical protein DY000_02028455 [Brassica cretica]
MEERYYGEYNGSRRARALREVSRRERDGLFHDPRGDRHRETPRDSSRSRRGERQRDEKISSSISSRIETERRGEIILDFVEEASRRARETKTLSSSIDHGGVEESERDEERSSSIDHGAVEVESRGDRLREDDEAESSREKHNTCVS